MKQESFFCFPNLEHGMFSREFPFCLFINYAYLCTWIGRHLKEAILWGTISRGLKWKNKT